MTRHFRYRLTMWQAVRQSHAIHPDWTVDVHLHWLIDEGYTLSDLYGGTPAEVVGRWLTEMDALPPLVAG